MTERRLTFIDVDENPFVVWLKDDRIQLSVIDSRPELEAGELRAFAAALFAAYGGAPLVARLDATREKLADVRDKLALAGSSDEVLAALDRSLCALTDVKRGLSAPRTTTTSTTTSYGEPAQPPPSAGAEIVALDSRRKKRPRGGRACEPDGACGWGEPAAEPGVDAQVR